jgi:ribosomal protein L40E
MYCKKCGTQLPDDAIYCSKCGLAQSSDELEYKNKMYRNKNKMLEDVTEMKAEGWRPFICRRIPLMGIGLLPILAHQAYTVIYERGTATTPDEKKKYKYWHASWIINARSNKIDELDEWLEEWEEKNR